MAGRSRARDFAVIHGPQELQPAQRGDRRARFPCAASRLAASVVGVAAAPSTTARSRRFSASRSASRRRAKSSVCAQLVCSRHRARRLRAGRGEATDDRRATSNDGNQDRARAHVTRDRSTAAAAARSVCNPAARRHDPGMIWQHARGRPRPDHPGGRHGHPQRHAGLVFRRRAATWTPAARSSTALDMLARGRGDHRHRRRIHPARRGRRSPPRRNCGASLPVIDGLLARAPDCLISVDTSKAAVARGGARRGAAIVNDVTALRGDPAMADVVARTGAGVVLMHMQGTPRTMQLEPHLRRRDRRGARVFRGTRSDRRGPPASPGLHRVRSRHRVRQDGRAQSDAAARTGRTARSDEPPAGAGRFAQIVPVARSPGSSTMAERLWPTVALTALLRDGARASCACTTFAPNWLRCAPPKPCSHRLTVAVAVSASLPLIHATCPAPLFLQSALDRAGLEFRHRDRPAGGRHLPCLPVFPRDARRARAHRPGAVSGDADGAERGCSTWSVIRWLIGRYSVFLAVALVVIFQPELRRVFAELGSRSFFRGSRQDKQTLDQLCDCVFELASRHYGALIAIERDIGLRSYAETGVDIDARVFHRTAADDLPSENGPARRRRHPARRTGRRRRVHLPRQPAREPGPFVRPAAPRGAGVVRGNGRRRHRGQRGNRQRFAVHRPTHPSAGCRRRNCGGRSGRRFCSRRRAPAFADSAGDAVGRHRDLDAARIDEPLAPSVLTQPLARQARLAGAGHAALAGHPARHRLLALPLPPSAAAAAERFPLRARRAGLIPMAASNTGLRRSHAYVEFMTTTPLPRPPRPQAHLRHRRRARAWPTSSRSPPKPPSSSAAPPRTSSPSSAAGTGRANPRPTIALGKDTRQSGYMLEDALAAGLMSLGVDVFQLGPLPTPGVAYITRSLRCDAGIVLTASHNSYEDNGIKFFHYDGYKLDDEHRAADRGPRFQRRDREHPARPPARSGARNASTTRWAATWSSPRRASRAS